MATYETTGTGTLTNLCMNEGDALQYTVTIVSGQNLAAGALLGKITSGGKYTEWTSGASDGSQTVAAILVDACDASDGDTLATVYVSGVFNKDAIPTTGAAVGIYFNANCNIIIKESK